jgi:hypothetical protein
VKLKNLFCGKGLKTGTNVICLVELKRLFVKNEGFIWIKKKKGV